MCFPLKCISKDRWYISRNFKLKIWALKIHQRCCFLSFFFSFLQGGRGIQGPQGAVGKKGENVSEKTILLMHHTVAVVFRECAKLSPLTHPLAFSGSAGY